MEELSHEQRVARDTLERYSGSAVEEYCSCVLLTNFPRYVEYFAEKRNLKIHEGAMFSVAHSPDEDITILDFKIGSPAAALIIDLCAHLPIKASLLLGMCGGLRRHYRVGDFFVPAAAIRGEGTSDFYFPPHIPALANFMIQKLVSEELEEREIDYHVGITYTMNRRFWEFDQRFKQQIMESRAQAVELECATLFLGSYRYKLPLGALMLVSDLPLERDGVKTKEKSEFVYENYTADHVELGVAVMRRAQARKTLKGMRREPISEG